MDKLYQLRDLLKQKGITAFLLPNNDEFQNEYLPQYSRRIEWLTGFTGSAAILIITEKQCAFFTDGRYLIQAKNEINTDEFSIYESKHLSPTQWLVNNNLYELWYDSSLHTEEQIVCHSSVQLRPMQTNPIDTLWKDRPIFCQSTIKIHTTYSGEHSLQKCKRLSTNIPFFITTADSICWLLNIRGNDIPHTPLLLSYAILYPNATIDLFLQNTQDINIGEHVFQHNMHEMPHILAQLPNLALDPSYTPIKFIQFLSEQSIIRKTDPCQLAKACKNSVEIDGAKQAHIRDGFAMIKFLFWVDNNRCTEKSAAEQLLTFREEQESFQEPSFPTISALGKNAAIIHYTQCDDTPITGNTFYLVDSGGQYIDGTTDITRTIPIGVISDEQKHHYTLVLKGHIALASAVFPIGTTGKQLDILARQYLWKEHLDYNHGTGHGIGSYLGVHEGPQSIGNDTPLQIGMILSNEPGFYKEGEYGIRIESLMHVVRKDINYLGFETLTLAPIDTASYDINVMKADEIKWIKTYNSNVYNTMHTKLSDDINTWYVAKYQTLDTIY